jgi:glycosyltransferase involved in cell wall biosynthesis
MSAGIPVIATDLPEIAKIVNEFRCGILVAKPDPEEISKAIIKIRDNRVLLDELKTNAFAAAESINWEKESIKVEKFYRSIINKL